MLRKLLLNFVHFAYSFGLVNFCFASPKILNPLTSVSYKGYLDKPSLVLTINSKNFGKNESENAKKSTKIHSQFKG
jgi:hypothetical protein